MKRVALVMLAVLAGCQSTPGARPAAAPKSVKVELSAPQRRDVSRTLELPGELRAWKEARLEARLSGYLKDLTVDIGDSVREGQLLGVIDSPESEREVAAARAQAAQARSQAAAMSSQVASRGSLQRSSQAQAARARAQSLGAEAQLTRARAQAELARQSYQRLKSVYAEDPALLARQELDQAWAQSRSAQAEVSAAQKELAAQRLQATALESTHQSAAQDVGAARSQQESAAENAEARDQEARKAETWLTYSQLRAPFAGVITRRYLDAGALVKAGPVFDLMDDHVIRVRIQVPELQAPLVQKGTPVEIRLEALPDETFQGHVVRTSRSLRVDSDRTMQAEADVPNPAHRLQPGMFARVKVSLQTHRHVLAVPTSAVLNEKGKLSVFLVAAGKAVKKPIEGGFADSGWTEVKQGLKEAESVISKGKETLVDGSAVEVR